MYIYPAAELIKKHEGLRLKPYQCPAGKLTIGYGRNLDENGITLSEAEQMLYNDIQNCYAECVHLACWNGLNEVRQAVLLDMCYNLGFTRLKGFKKMFAALQAGDYAKAAKEMLNSAWARQVKGRVDELANLMEKGE